MRFSGCWTFGGVVGKAPFPRALLKKESVCAGGGRGGEKGIKCCSQLAGCPPSSPRLLFPSLHQSSFVTLATVPSSCPTIASYFTTSLPPLGDRPQLPSLPKNCTFVATAIFNSSLQTHRGSYLHTQHRNLNSFESSTSNRAHLQPPIDLPGTPCSSPVEPERSSYQAASPVAQTGQQKEGRLCHTD